MGKKKKGYNLERKSKGKKKGKKLGGRRQK